MAAANVLQLMIERYVPEITDLRIATKASEATALFNKFHPELIFQDIVMPEKNGFELLSELANTDFEVIFTTAYNEYAIQAIRFSALDYLLKPINADELGKAVARFLEKRSQKNETESLLKNLLHNLAQKEETNFRLAVPTSAGAVFFSPIEIIRCEGEGNYTWFFLTNNRKHLSAKTMKEYEEILIQHNFLRIHKSHLVNRAFVNNYLNEGAVILTDKTKLPVSRQRKEEVRLSIGNKK